MKGKFDVDIAILVGTLVLAEAGFIMLSPFWAYFGACFIGSLAIWELVSKMRSGKTLTQRFKAIMKKNPKKAIFAIVALDIFFIYLNIHLLVAKGMF